MARSSGMGTSLPMTAAAWSTERGLDVAPLSLSHHVFHREPPVLVGGARRAPVEVTMRGDAGAGAGRWRLVWHPPAPMERIVCIACRPRASAGTSRSHAGARWRNGTGACRSAAIRLGGSPSWATDRRNSSAAPRPPRAPVTPPYDSADFARYRRVRVPL